MSAVLECCPEARLWFLHKTLPKNLDPAIDSHGGVLRLKFSISLA